MAPTTTTTTTTTKKKKKRQPDFHVNFLFKPKRRKKANFERTNVLTNSMEKLLLINL